MAVWKDFERELAKWFSSKRNIGSGKINSTDSGKPRPGDVIMPVKYKTLIEAKTRKKFPKSGIYHRALQTLEDAKAENMQNFFHYERKNGSKQIYILATNQEWMKKITNFIRKELDKEYEE
ncbi:hypothetical protein COV24_02200 [candidate division WWE3 bacterium CG10_big_fil_rev_8_21_14_0_10_32_10]|uniref:Uncharacterized protein n=1 Tax=candidate division WWE3 bacterium CG10_big_fil_rev_8_21_14_0_10_32_10 TaxID=1975090 RepID=A0A2H0RAN1_UNCKA|nr:MAG: hypothetical protein COV24_02200 [candidate division WWE3 bacterium CG10_big_fil_rev_8_21_14_0_10_32_10]